MTDVPAPPPGAAAAALVGVVAPEDGDGAERTDAMLRNGELSAENAMEDEPEWVGDTPSAAAAFGSLVPDGAILGDDGGPSVPQREFVEAVLGDRSAYLLYSRSIHLHIWSTVHSDLPPPDVSVYSPDAVIAAQLVLAGYALVLEDSKGEAGGEEDKDGESEDKEGEPEDTEGERDGSFELLRTLYQKMLEAATIPRGRRRNPLKDTELDDEMDRLAKEWRVGFGDYLRRIARDVEVTDASPRAPVLAAMLLAAEVMHVVRMPERYVDMPAVLPAAMTSIPHTRFEMGVIERIAGWVVFLIGHEKGLHHRRIKAAQRPAIRELFAPWSDTVETHDHHGHLIPSSEFMAFYVPFIDLLVVAAGSDMMISPTDFVERLREALYTHKAMSTAFLKLCWSHRQSHAVSMSTVRLAYYKITTLSVTFVLSYVFKSRGMRGTSTSFHVQIANSGRAAGPANTFVGHSPDQVLRMDRLGAATALLPAVTLPKAASLKTHPCTWFSKSQLIDLWDLVIERPCPTPSGSLHPQYVEDFVRGFRKTVHVAFGERAEG